MTTQAAMDAPATEIDGSAPVSSFTSLISVPEILETARIVTPREDLNDEAFAAVKRGDAQKLRDLLGAGLDADATDAQGVSLMDRAVQRYKDLSRAVEEGETEGSQDELIKKLDPDARADAGMAALVLASANGNVEVAQMLLNSMEDDTLLGDDDDDIAEEIALEHGNMSVFLAILARKQRSDFNKAAHDVHSEEREPNYKDTMAQSFGEWFKANYEYYSERLKEETHQFGETVREDARAVRAAFGRAAHYVGHATSEACHAAMAFCSGFFHHKSQDGVDVAPPQVPQDKLPGQDEAIKDATEAASLINRIFGFDRPNNRP